LDPLGQLSPDRGEQRHLAIDPSGLTTNVDLRHPSHADQRVGTGTQHQLAFVDVDSVQRRVYGATKQGAAFGHAKVASKSLLVRGLNALVATVCTPLAAPVVVAARLRGGNAGSARGAASLVAEPINTARAAGARGMTLLFVSRSFRVLRPLV
jgi:hypothetical protein